LASFVTTIFRGRVFFRFTYVPLRDFSVQLDQATLTPIKLSPYFNSFSPSIPPFTRRCPPQPSECILRHPSAGCITLVLGPNVHFSCLSPLPHRWDSETRTLPLTFQPSFPRHYRFFLIFPLHLSDPISVLLNYKNFLDLIDRRPSGATMFFPFHMD